MGPPAPPARLEPLRAARRLRPGDRIALVAPSGPVPEQRFAAGVAVLAARYDITFDAGLFSRTGFLAGDDDRRAAELAAALSDPSVRAIWCARGGYGLTRLLGRLDLGALSRDPRPVIGFSDGTALLAAVFGAGLRALHGPVATQLGELCGAGGADDDSGTDPGLGAALFALLEDPAPPPSWRDLEGAQAGVAEGLAVGGNLEVYSRLVGTRHMPAPPAGAPLVLFVEDVGERPYRIDRALTHLRDGGALDRVAACVIGDLTRCDEPDGTSDAREVVVERLAQLGVPVVLGAPFGHGTRNRPFVTGARVRVDGTAGRVDFLDGLVDGS